MSEQKLQAECTQWFWNKYVEHRRMLFHCNNNSHNREKGSMMKALGVVKGVADLCLVADGMVFFIELKVGTNSQTEEQKDFMGKVLARGHGYVVIRELEQFKEFICKVIGK